MINYDQTLQQFEEEKHLVGFVAFSNVLLLSVADRAAVCGFFHSLIYNYL